MFQAFLLNHWLEGSVSHVTVNFKPLKRYLYLKLSNKAKVRYKDFLVEYINTMQIKLTLKTKLPELRKISFFFNLNEIFFCKKKLSYL